MKHAAAISVLILAHLASFGQQQQSKTWIDSDGNKQIVDLKQGYTEIHKDGTKGNLSPADVTRLCNNLDQYPALGQSEDGKAAAQLCEVWALLQPRTQVEKLHWDELINRLMLLTPASTNFERYRGMELKSDASAKTYDATIVPDDLGYQPSCTIEVEDRADLGMLYTYECIVKTHSYGMAISLQKLLAKELADLPLPVEDQVREHGLYANAKNKGLCAPTGECALEHTYVTAVKDWKTLQIEAWPDFTRNVVLELMTSEHGKHAAITGVAGDSGSVSFEIMSVGPREANDHGTFR
ncbi:MAG: hypothetical protein ACR2JE_02710 [Acidobacteriaceae bacterium]